MIARLLLGLMLALVAAAPTSFAADAQPAAPAADAPPAVEAPKFLEKTTERGPVKTRVHIEPAAPVIGPAADAGHFQWPHGGYQEVRLAKGEWAGPNEEPAE